MSPSISLDAGSFLTLYRELRAAWCLEITRSIAEAEDRGAGGWRTLARVSVDWPPLVAWTGLDLYIDPRTEALDIKASREKVSRNFVQRISNSRNEIMKATMLR